MKTVRQVLPNRNDFWFNNACERERKEVRVRIRVRGDDDLENEQLYCRSSE